MPAPDSSPGGWPSARIAWILGGAMVLVVLLGGVLLWRAARPAARAARDAAASEDPAETRLHHAVEARPDNAQTRIELGKYEEGHGRPFEAMWEYAEARRLAPAETALPVRLAAVLRAGEVVDLATKQLLDTLGARPGDLEVRRQLADLYLATAEPERARSVMEARRAAVWQDADAALTLGRAAQAVGDDRAAIAAFRRSLALERDKHEAWYHLGRLYLRQARNEEARDAFFHAMGSLRSRPEYPFYAGITFLEENRPGDLKRAISFFQDALALKPSYAAAQYQYGLALARLNRRPEAISRYSLAILADTNYPEPHLALGRALVAMGNTQDAHRYLGRYYDLKDRPDDAVRELQRMAAAAPSSTQPALLVGQVYIRTQQSERAVAATEAALRRHPDDVQLLERLAVLKINRGDRPYARRLLHRWLELKPKASRPCWLLGRCELADLKYSEGIAWLEKAIARAPRNPHYLSFLAGGLLRLGTPASSARAAELMAQAVALAPNDAEYRDLYGQALQRIGQYENARRQFLKALNADPSQIASYTPVAQLAWRLHRPGPAAFFAPVIRSVQQRLSEERLLWTHVWEHPADAAGRLELARFFCRTAHLTRARDQLEQLLAQRPDSAEARRLMATVQRALDVQ